MKTWRQKMITPDLPKVVRLTARQRKRFGGARELLIPRPLDVDARDGRRDITPWWRTIRPDGRLVDKFPRGQSARLKKEGHRIRDGRVIDFERRLQPL